MRLKTHEITLDRWIVTRIESQLVWITTCLDQCSVWNCVRLDPVHLAPGAKGAEGRLESTGRWEHLNGTVQGGWNASPKSLIVLHRSNCRVASGQKN
jgi:hypothetical protein